MYDRVRREVKLNATVLGLESTDDGITAIIISKMVSNEGSPIDALILPYRSLLTSRMVGHNLHLSYRTVHAVYLLLNQPKLSDNHWIYFMDDDIVINRMVEFKNMSPLHTPEKTTVVCAEVTCIDEKIPERVIQDLVRVGLIREDDVLDTNVISEPHAYPIYDTAYEAKISATQDYFTKFKNLYTVGRAAEFKHREVDDNFASAVVAIEAISAQFISRPTPPWRSAENAKITTLNGTSVRLSHLKQVDA